MRIFGDEILKGGKAFDEADARRRLIGLILGLCEIVRVLG